MTAKNARLSPAALSFATLILCASFGTGCAHSRIKTNLVPAVPMAKRDFDLYCGYTRKGCEELNHNTLRIKASGDGRVAIIRAYQANHELTVTAFSGRFSSDDQITARYNPVLSEKYQKQSQSNLPAGEIEVGLTCSDGRELSSCKVSAHAVASKEADFSDVPGWVPGDFSEEPNQLSCREESFFSEEVKKEDCISPE